MRTATVQRRTPFVLALVLSVSGALLAGATPASARGVLPDGFRAQSISFVTRDHGWILGKGGCGATANCTQVLHTVNGGQTWHKVGAIHAPLDQDKIGGVSEIRFADDLHGWAFYPSFWATDDGGHTWTKQAIPGGGLQVPVVAADADATYALISHCRLSQTPATCTPAELWKSTLQLPAWTKTSLKIKKGLVTNAARISMHGEVAYLIVPTESDPDFVRATVNGTFWQPRPDPCTRPDESVVDVTATSDTGVVFTCVGDPGLGHSWKRVFRSNDTGRTAATYGAIPTDGIVTQLAAAPNGRLIMTSWGAPGSWIYRSNVGRAWTTPEALGDNGAGWNDVTMTTNQVGFVVHGPAAVYPAGERPGQLAETQDGGESWLPV